MAQRHRHRPTYRHFHARMMPLSPSVVFDHYNGNCSFPSAPILRLVSAGNAGDSRIAPVFLLTRSGVPRNQSMTALRRDRRQFGSPGNDCERPIGVEVKMSVDIVVLAILVTHDVHVSELSAGGGIGC